MQNKKIKRMKLNKKRRIFVCYHSKNGNLMDTLKLKLEELGCSKFFYYSVDDGLYDNHFKYMFLTNIILKRSDKFG